MLEDEMKQNIPVEYIAQHVWYIAKAVFGLRGIDLTSESYMEFAHPQVAKRDSRTAQQIKDDILQRLSE